VFHKGALIVKVCFSENEYITNLPKNKTRHIKTIAELPIYKNPFPQNGTQQFYYRSFSESGQT
jgi:hypothetical protein